MLIKLKLITAIVGINLFSYHTDKKEVIILDSFPRKNASLPELMEYYNFKTIDKDSSKYAPLYRDSLFIKLP